MIVYEGVRTFQQQMTKYINGNDIVIIEDGKTNTPKGTFVPYTLYLLFQEQINEAIRVDIQNSFVEEFDCVGLVNEH